MTVAPKLFAVYLGGNAPKGNTELHDVIFVTGTCIEDTYEQCMDKWFGTPDGLHLDSWMELDVVDGHRVRLTNVAQPGDKKLFFVNLGAYRDGEFNETHANKLLVAADALEAKVRAKKLLLQGWPGQVHTDNLFEVDSCLEITSVGGWRVALTETSEPEQLTPHNGYHLVPKYLVQEYMERHGLALAQKSA